MIVIFPRLENGNVMWTCDNCGDTAEVSCVDTNSVALVCQCDGKVHPKCNDKWYYQGLYWERIPIENRKEYRKNVMRTIQPENWIHGMSLEIKENANKQNKK